MDYRYTRGTKSNVIAFCIVILLSFFLLNGVMAENNENDYKVITVKSGDTISYLCFKMYRKYNDTIADHIRNANPKIKNIDRIYTGQKIRFPILEEKKETPEITAPTPIAKDQSKPSEESVPPPDQKQAGDAYLTYLEGKATVQNARTKQWEPIHANAKLGQGDKIRVGENSKAELITFDCDTVRLSENSELEINRMEHNPVEKTTSKNLFIRMGRMWNKAKRLFYAKSEYTVRTPNAVAGVRGTAYNIDVLSEEQTRIKTYSGEVSVWKPTAQTVSPDWKLSTPTKVSGPKAVTIQQWSEILVKINEELVVTNNGAVKKSFDPQQDELNDEWIKWNKARDADFDR